MWMGRLGSRLGPRTPTEFLCVALVLMVAVCSLPQLGPGSDSRNPSSPSLGTSGQPACGGTVGHTRQTPASQLVQPRECTGSMVGPSPRSIRDGPALTPWSTNHTLAWSTAAAPPNGVGEGAGFAADPVGNERL